MNLISKLIDIIYPPRCAICQEFIWDEQPFCRTCSLDFRTIHSPFCPLCGRPFHSPTGDKHPCEDCLRKRPFYEAAAAPYLYEGSLMTAIHHYKYGPKSSLAKSLGPLLADFAEGWIINADGLLTMPVPLHLKRLRERGFNQSLLLARHVAGRLHSELDFLSLRRIRYTLPQTGLGKDERRKNVRGAFELKEPEMVKGKTILLIDDVSTTGNTLNECARVLKKAGSNKVFCLLLARAGSF